MSSVFVLVSGLKIIGLCEQLCVLELKGFGERGQVIDLDEQLVVLLESVEAVDRVGVLCWDLIPFCVCRASVDFDLFPFLVDLGSERTGAALVDQRLLQFFLVPRSS